MSRLSVVIATHNPGKVAELRSLLADLSVELSTISEVVPSFVPPVEDGATFEENALIKARAAAAATQMVSIADDSGLEVDALDGAPGVQSARYGGDGLDDAGRTAALLAAVADTEDRHARFRCVLVAIGPDGEEVSADGTLEGTLARAPRGEGGFGYDPILIPAGDTRTCGELTRDEKNAISHRGAAARALRDTLGL